MDGIWEALGLEPTRDISAIKRAYARKARTCHPEEDPAGFSRLRQAYQAALDYAEGTDGLSEDIPEEEAPAEEESWTLPEEEESGPNPYEGGEAIQKFVELYTGKQRKNPKLWMDYFSSAAFLDAAWDGCFTRLLLEKVTELEPDCPPSKEFLMWLSVAYQLTGDAPPEVRDFDGLSAIRRIVAKGHFPKRPKGNEFAMLQSFQDYRHLTALADSGVWNAQALEEFKWIAGRYSSAYIKERCEQRVAPDCERHPAGLRVFIHFFRRKDLPEQLYRIVWAKFDLKNAVMGRANVLYGPLREIAMERVAEIAEEAPENFFQLNQEREACFQRVLAAPEREEEELDALFAREDLRRALRSRRFIEEQLVPWHNWMNSFAPEGCVRRLAEFYRAHPEIYDWRRVVEQAELILEAREAERQRQAELLLESEEEHFPEELDLSWLLEVVSQIILKPLTGPERVFVRLCLPEYEDEDDLPEEEEEDIQAPPPGLFERGDEKKPLTERDLSVLLERYAAGEVERLELFLNGNQMVLVQDQERGQYGCFCFEIGYDTWYALLSQVEEYTVVDCKDVKYYPFGMGMLGSYDIHHNTDRIMSKLNLALHQLAQGRPQTRAGSTWVWSSHTSQNNSRFKCRMAMQKFAKIPPERVYDYVLSKFVVSKHPDQAETVTLAGERRVTRLQPGSYGLASGALVQFFQEKLASLRLSWEWKTEDGPVRRHMLLLKEGTQYMMAWLDDAREWAALYAIDAPRFFGGRMYPACLVHQDLRRIRNCVDLILDDMSRAELVVDRPGEFVPILRPYQEIRAELVREE